MKKQEVEPLSTGCFIAFVVGFVIALAVTVGAVMGFMYVVTDALCVAFDKNDETVACQSVHD